MALPDVASTFMQAFRSLPDKQKRRVLQALINRLDPCRHADCVRHLRCWTRHYQARVRFHGDLAAFLSHALNQIPREFHPALPETMSVLIPERVEIIEDNDKESLLLELADILVDIGKTELSGKAYGFVERLHSLAKKTKR